jgi:hypothetical protein
MNDPNIETVSTGESQTDSQTKKLALYDTRDFDGPSVLDYLKALLSFWRTPIPKIPPPDLQKPQPPRNAEESDTFLLTAQEEQTAPITIPWIPFGMLVSALIGQIGLNPPNRSLSLGLLGYGFAIIFGVLSFWQGNFYLSSPKEVEPNSDTFAFKRIPFLVASLLAVIAFLLFGGNSFSSLNVLLWICSLVAFLVAFWQPRSSLRSIKERLYNWRSKQTWQIPITRWTLLVILTIAISAFFRFYRLDSVPSEMVSDHAEKLLDVYDVLGGQTRIFFPRNTGREPLQFYLIALTIKIFNTGISFLSMKIGTSLLGLLSLIYVYKLGEEIGNKWVGILAATLMGIAYWPNILARVALRFILYPAFVAPTLYYLIRGLRRGLRNDFIIAGVTLGIGLHGYTPFRIVPFLVIVVVAIYIVHRESQNYRRQTLFGLALLAFFAFIIFIPLLRYWVEYPEVFAFRAFSRIGTTERPIPGPAYLILLSNLAKSLAMVNWSSGNIWVVGISNYPALELISAAFFLVGIVLLFTRYIRQRSWLDLVLLLSYPLLMMPAILSLAFPDENPALNRSGGVSVIVFLIAAIGLEGLLQTIRHKIGGKFGQRTAFVLAGALVFFSATLNYNLTFERYAEQFRLGAWNTSEMGSVIENFANTIGDPDTAWVVAYPHWVDNRLVGINAGFPNKDYSIWPEAFPTTLEVPGPKLFLVKVDDEEALAQLHTLYPQGVSSLHDSYYENKDFYIFFVPAEDKQE